MSRGILTIKKPVAISESDRTAISYDLSLEGGSPKGR